MKPYIYQINIKPETRKEVGLPKVKTRAANVLISGLDGDYNRFRNNKKNGDPDMALMILSLDIIKDLNIGPPVKAGDLGENLTVGNIEYRSLKTAQYAGVLQKLKFLYMRPRSNLRVLPYVKWKKIKFYKDTCERRGWYARVLEPGKITEKDLLLTI